MALKQIKNKIIATQKTGKVTKAMEAVSAVKMRKSQERALSGKSYAEAAIRILYRISKSRDAKEFIDGQPNAKGEHCFIVVTSDKGLAGSLNSAVLKETEIAIRALKKSDVTIIAFGKKAYEFFERNGYDVVRHYTNVSDDVVIGDMREITELILKHYESGVFSHVSIAFQSFASTFEQQAVLRQVLPLDPFTLEIMVRDIVPKRGAKSELSSELAGAPYTVEPNIEEVARILIPQLIQIMVYHALLENKASEHSARMVAMKNATDKAKEMTRALTLVYNKERQAAITAEVSEITGGIEALKT